MFFWFDMFCWLSGVISKIADYPALSAKLPIIRCYPAKLPIIRHFHQNCLLSGVSAKLSNIRRYQQNCRISDVISKIAYYPPFIQRCHRKYRLCEVISKIADYTMLSAKIILFHTNQNLHSSSMHRVLSRHGRSWLSTTYSSCGL